MDDKMKIHNRSIKNVINENSLEQQVEELCKKYTEMCDENRKLQLALKQSKQKTAVIQHEKGQLQNDRSKAIGARQKLEALCRELRKQNKVCREESASKIIAEVLKTRDIVTNFESATKEMNVQLNQLIEQTVKPDLDRLDSNYKQLIHKRESFIEFYAITKSGMKMLETDVAIAERDVSSDKFILLLERQEKEKLHFKLASCDFQIHELQTTISSLNSQVNRCIGKYNEFISRSDKEFNKEMEKMLERILILEAESRLWRKHWEILNAAQIEMTSVNQTRAAEMTILHRKLTWLRTFCKTLHDENTILHGQLNSDDRIKVSQLQTVSASDYAPVINAVKDITVGCLKQINELDELQKAVYCRKILLENLKNPECILYNTCTVPPPEPSK